MKATFKTGLTAFVAISTLLPALASAQTATPPTPPAPVGRKLVEIYRIAPGKHEEFLRAVARLDDVNRKAGLPARELYVHSDGASWDFLLIQDADTPAGKEAALTKAWAEAGLPSGPRFFIEFRSLLLEHTDTFAKGPTTAGAYLTELDATPKATFRTTPQPAASPRP